MRFKKIFAMLLTGIMTVSMPGAVFAATTEEQIPDVQAQKEAAQAECSQTGRSCIKSSSPQTDCLFI